MVDGVAVVISGRRITDISLVVVPEVVVVVPEVVVVVVVMVVVVKVCVCSWCA